MLFFFGIKMITIPAMLVVPPVDHRESYCGRIHRIEQEARPHHESVQSFDHREPYFHQIITDPARPIHHREREYQSFDHREPYCGGIHRMECYSRQILEPHHREPYFVECFYCDDECFYGDVALFGL